jgi:hypothetical protein
VKAARREHQCGIRRKSDESREVLNALDLQSKTTGLVLRQEINIMCYFVSLWALDFFVPGAATEASVSSAFLMAKLAIVKFSFSNWQINEIACHEKCNEDQIIH